jgi:hypothetical protein
MESGETVVGFRIKDGMSVAGTACVVLSSKMMRYWGEELGSSGISITVPARLHWDDGLMLRTLVPGGYGLLMDGLSFLM